MMQIQNISQAKSPARVNFKGMHLINSTPKATQAVLDLHHVFARNASEAHLSFDEKGQGIFGFTFPKGYESIEHSFLTIIDQLKGFYGEASISHLMINEPKRSLADELSRRSQVRKTITGFQRDSEPKGATKVMNPPEKAVAQTGHRPIGFHQIAKSEKV